ncbi:hypothetical protein [Streptomyces sp. NPDC051677]|uniref:hypothetical protein n=1 Tax=Streptomyces sp. NPDC051677 TaxID=3365669 RepID=UPI0037D8F022
MRDLTVQLRKQFGGALILNPATDGPTGPDVLTLIEEGVADLVAYGRLFLANPRRPAVSGPA